MPMARNFAVVGTAIALSRIVGFFRDVGIAAVLGAGVLSDAFLASLQIPNLFRRLLAESALNSAFVPLWIRVREESGARAARRFGEQVLGIIVAALGSLAVLGVVFAPAVVHLIAPGFDAEGERFAYAVYYVRLSIPYIAIAGFVAIAASFLNAEGRVAAASFGLVVFNAVTLAAVVGVLTAGSAQSAGAVLSLAVVIGGLAQFALLGTAAARLPEPPLRPRLGLSSQVRYFFILVGPGVIAAGVPQLKLMAGAMVASPSQAAVSWLLYANRLYETPLNIVSFATASVLVPAIAESVRSGEKSAIAAAQSRGFELGLGLALPAAVAFAVLAQPIVGGLFERGAFGPQDTVAVAAALTAMSAGLPGHVLEKVFGAVSFAHEDTRTPMLAALAGLAVAVASALILFPHYGHVGVAAGIAISGWVGASILGTVLLRRRWLSLDAEAARRLPLIILAAAMMGTAIFVAHRSLAALFDLSGSQLVRFGVFALLVATGLAVYLASLELLGVARWREIVATIRNRPFAG